MTHSDFMFNSGVPQKPLQQQFEPFEIQRVILDNWNETHAPVPHIQINYMI